MDKAIICLSCPIGCHLTGTIGDDGTIRIEGNKCPRGEIYGREELSAPKRTVTATIAVNSRHMQRIPVKTDKPLLKELIPALLAALARKKIEVPAKCGDTVITNFSGSGVGVVLTRSVRE